MNDPNPNPNECKKIVTDQKIITWEQNEDWGSQTSGFLFVVASPQTQEAEQLLSVDLPGP